MDTIIPTCCFVSLAILIAMSSSARGLATTEESKEQIQRVLSHMRKDNTTLDLVFVLDRSAGVSKQSFYKQQKNIARDITRHYARVYAPLTRVAVVTFGGDVEVAFDRIDVGEEDALMKCDLEGDSLWRAVSYHDNADQSHGTNIYGGVERAMQILISSKRNTRPQVSWQMVILMTDLEWRETDRAPDDLAQRMSDENIDLMLIGVGTYLQEDMVPTLLGGVYTEDRYAHWQVWEDVLVQEGDLHVAGYGSPKWFEYNGSDCDPASCSTGTRCMCDIISGISACLACEVATVCTKPPVSCENGGVSVEKDGVVEACRCVWGYRGYNCDVDYDECVQTDICKANQVCEDDASRPNSVVCTDDDDVTTSEDLGGSSGPGDSSSNTGASEDRQKMKTLFLVFGPIGAFALIIIVLAVGALVFVVKKEREHDDEEKNTETTNVSLSRNPSLTTMLTFDSQVYTEEGVPSAPTYVQRADVVDVKDNLVAENIYGNDVPKQQGMEEWVEYVMDVVAVGLEQVIVMRLDGEKWVMSPGFRKNMNEVATVYTMLSSKQPTARTLTIQGAKYNVLAKEEMVLRGESAGEGGGAAGRRGEGGEVLCASKSRQFVVIGLANKKTDNGECSAEVVRLTQHIRHQGL